MRTQLILTTALLGVAGSIGASAQVYSVNAVGYINVTVPAGKFAMVANQLSSGGNKVSEVLLPANDLTLYVYVNGGYVINSFTGGAWDDTAQTLPPGTAFFIKNDANVNQTLTFVGEVPQGNLTTPLAKGFNLTGSQVPQAGKLVTDLKFPVTATSDETVYTWDVPNQTYITYSVIGGAWEPSEPVIGVAEGFWVTQIAAQSWTRSFSVN